MKNAETNVQDRYGGDRQYLDPSVFKTGIKDLIEVDMDKASAEDALNCQLAYYKVKLISKDLASDNCLTIRV